VHRSRHTTLDTAAPNRRLSHVRGRLVLVAFGVLLVLVGLLATSCGSDLDRLTEEAVGLMSAGRFDDALPIQERIASLDPADAQIRLELGFNYLNHQKDPSRAVTVFKQAVQIEPSAKNMTFLAQAEVVAGDTTSAEAELRQAIEVDPSYPHPYGVLLSLLEEQGRTQEAAQLRQAAESAGITLALNDNSQD
jgi:Tfp pilus assembly protein PilF